MDNRIDKPDDLQERGFLDRIGNRILALVGTTFLLGTVGVTILFTQDLERTILSQHERSLNILTETVGSGLQTIMQSGSAEIAESYVEDIKQVKDLSQIRILRTDGREAFIDNETILHVNKLMGGEVYSNRDVITGTTSSPSELEKIRLAVEKKQNQTLSTTHPENGDAQLTVFYPIPNLEECMSCHGEDHAVRGILEVTTSMQQAKEEISAMRTRIILVQLGALLLILTIIFKRIHHYVVKPIERLNQSMQAMTDGAIEQKADVEGSSEFRMMAVCFNKMSSELARTHSGLQDERDKLTTIILSAKEGIIVTDKNEQIVLVNPSAERLLGKDMDEICQSGFRNILNDPEHLAAIMKKDVQSVPDIIVFNSRMLQIQATTIFSNDQEMVGSAALIRDVTQEKELERELRHLSNTDALTGLFNRRRFDMVLDEEYRRAKRYNLMLGLLLFDVDHFKKFNDTYGHDQGDRVLQAIGKVMNCHFRDIDHPCRYGGEEFCAVLPSTGLEGVEIAAERLREKIEEMRVDELQVTISIGVAIYPDSGSKNPEQLLKMADDALYQAKEKGRNQVRFAPTAKKKKKNS
ncbi:MAG: diguanylate cyclase [Magnetococcales bacterium]|nr:diguanylate cyclase [Magnetococcales bacterium]